MLNGHEELDSYDHKKYPIPAYIQRSASAPAIAEHVSEAILPAYQYEEEQDGMAANPNRMNPRMANGKKGDAEAEQLNSSYAELFDEGQGGEANKASLLSLINDTFNRTPMDLIQADFPSTPSSVYSKRIFDPELKDGELNVETNGKTATQGARKVNGNMSLMKNASLNSSQSSVASPTEAVEQTTKSLENLYVNPVQDISPKSISAAQPNAPLLSQYTPASNSILSSVQGESSVLGFNDNGSSKPFNKPSTYNTLLGNNPSAILNNGLNPLAPAVGMGGMLGMNTGSPGSTTQGQAGGQQQQANQQQPAYYVQQAVYLDQNGNPIFYRPMPNQYGQDFMYPGSNTTGEGDIQGQMPQPAFMPFPGAVPGMPQAGGYYDQVNGMPIFMAGNQQGMPGMGVPVAMGGMDSSRRMVFNPATGQYSPMQAGRGIGGQQQGQAGYLGQTMMLGAGMGMPTLLPRNNMHMMDGTDMFGGRDDDRNGGGYMDSYGRNDRRNDRDRDYNRNNDRDMRRGDRDRDRNNDRDRNGRNSVNNGMNPVRDSLVEEFRNTYGKSRQWGLRDLLGHVVAFCQDQHGSRFIQQRLEVCSDVDKQLIFDEIIPAAQSLMTDVFGNYVLQKLFEYGTPDQCESLAILLKGQAVQLAMQMYGCRVVQKALEYVGTPRLIELVQEFESPPLLLRCVHDSNGNHVIQKCIEIVSKASKDAATPDAADYLSGRIQFIITAFQGKVKELSSHPYGCRVVQRILEHCSNAQKAVILEELRQCCTELVQDCYGNYVIQFVMQHGWEADRAVLIREVQSNLLDFSQHKFASNVVEKCLQYASKKDRDEMIWTIINVTFDLKNPVDAKGHCVLESMVRDPYANYVVQKVIDVSDDRQRAAIMRYVKENITQLRRYTYGKHIIVRLEKITNEKF